MIMDQYDELRKLYPNEIYMDSLYRILGISKRAAQYLIVNDLIPSIDTGKKTWRYRIRLEDAIVYLRKREQQGSLIPSGALSSRRPAVKPKPLEMFIPSYDEKRFVSFLTMLLKSVPDVVSLYEAAQMIDSSKRKLLIFIEKGVLLHFVYKDRIMIPKKSLIVLVASRDYLDSNRGNAQIQRLCGEYEIWCGRRSAAKSRNHP